ncbi:TlyA family RNA methyltransferase [Desulfosediminicola flagellatus]|uniref:TlyA family RNA methyltransferase n=1 Tax=Desulfosediminicola flagellatus TaxID=2569541 RepID=UPI0023DDD1C5|nr:TlyA family RNA methyltransferase [Desulfosediminicola flagellatus]
MMKKIRLDQLLVQRNFCDSLSKAQAVIGAGEVYVNDTPADKAGQPFPADAPIRVKEKCRYVSRGGLKLERGLEYFNINATDMCCLDVGASSGGFTDCLLQNGAAKVFAVDVAYGQLDWKIRQDERVVVIERFNARKLTPEVLKQPIDLAVMDTSFISITKIIPFLLPLFNDTLQIVALIKPQFELPKYKIGKGGVVRDSELHQEAIDLILEFADKINLTSHGVVESPIRGPKGNTEFLIHLSS